MAHKKRKKTGHKIPVSRSNPHTKIVIGLVLIVATLNIGFIAFVFMKSAPRISFPLKRTIYVIPKTLHTNAKPQIIKLPIVMYH